MHPSGDSHAGDLLQPSDFVVLVVPIDKAAPKGRLILPQQQTIRDILEADAVSIVVRENELKDTLAELGKKPRMVITDKFEWLVVDDGSTDGSYEFLLDLQKGGGPFVIHVYQQENSGKHVAVNRGLDVARGDLFFIVDSDDYLPENSVDIIYRTFEEMTDSDDRYHIKRL